MFAITPTTEMFRLAVAASPAASTDYPTPAVTGSLEGLVVFMERHHAHIEAYAQLAGITHATATERVTQAAHRLSESREWAADRWSALCIQAEGVLSAVYQLAQNDPLVRRFSEAALLTMPEAINQLAQLHLIRSNCNAHPRRWPCVADVNQPSTQDAQEGDHRDLVWS